MHSFWEVKLQSVEEFEELAENGDIEAKRELARNLMDYVFLKEDEKQAIELLEDCVVHGDAEAMLMLAQCCAIGRGIEYDAVRAKALISQAAEKGNDEALSLMKFINEWKGYDFVYLSGLDGL